MSRDSARNSSVRLVLLLVTIILLFAIIIVGSVRLYANGRTARMFQGYWVEVGDGDFLTHIDFHRNTFGAGIYTSFAQIGDGAHPIGPISGRPWGGCRAERGGLYEANTSFWHFTGGSFRIVDYNYIVFFFSSHPPGRGQPYMVELLQFSISDDTLVLAGASGTVAFARV